VTLSHTRRGSGPPLVLLHGVGCQYQYWYPVLDRLAAERDVIAIDFPGFGDSPALPDGTRPTPRALADATRDFLDELGLDKPHIAGNSLGGWVALELARDGRAASVAAISPAGFELPREAKFSINSLRSTGKSAKLMYDSAPKVLANPWVRKLAFAQVFAKGERLTTEEAVRSIRNVADSPGWEPTLDELEHGRFTGGHEVTVPTTFLWGDKERLLIPRDRQASRCIKSVPGSKLIWLRGCGHTPMWDDPPQVADAILEASAQN
jgi:pimeloyl-ACP methyl ester carboxylesterase